MMEETTKPVWRGLMGVYFDRTSITEIQGNEGVLRHRGYSIDQLALDPSYEKVAYLLIHGDWPDDEQARAFHAELAACRDLPPGVIDILRSMKDAPPHVALRTAVSSLGGHAGERYGQHRDWAPIALLPSMVVVHEALRCGRPVPEPRPDLDLPSDFLSRLLGRSLSPFERYIINLDFVLHADHGANASTFVARVVTSTESDVHAALTAAIAAFAGRRHGGAIEGVAEMLDELGTPEAARTFVKNYRPGDSEPIAGFGHRVYRVEDPRAKLFRKAVETLSDSLDDRHLLETLDALVVAMEPYRRFGLSPNVDLYAAVVYRLLGVPDDLPTTIFAVARSAGWIAQLQEQRANNILIRPRLLYDGPGPRDLT